MRHAYGARAAGACAFASARVAPSKTRAHANDGDASNDRRATPASPATIASIRALSAASSAAIDDAGYRRIDRSRTVLI
jgi:hypothetical protein